MEEQTLDQVIENAADNGEQLEQSAPVDVATQPTPPAQANSYEQNIKRLREKAERTDYLERELARVMQEQQRSTAVPADDSSGFADDDLVEGKHLKKVKQELRDLKKEIESYKQTNSAMTAEARIKAQFNDFDKVVTKDTIANLRESYPEIAATINSNSDVYTQAVAAYTLIKKLNIAPDEQYAADRNRVQANTAKPRPLTSVSPQSGESPLSRANAFAEGLTPELRKNLFREMQESKKNR